jgi:phosphotransferase system HPr (HPr) family protein
MVTKTIRFHGDKVLPMKTVAILIQKASSYRSNIWIARGVRKANAKSLLGVMSLGITGDIEITVSAEGSDETTALDDVCTCLVNPDF